ncbi:MAG TPA: hypothetical protein VJM81_02430 [Rhizorhapis sp.]|nr:hypothetical protein [Rhizorhapis sp.]
MSTAFFIKTLGYVVSIVSVVLLAIVSWKSAHESGWLTFALFGGVATSVSGMGLRWVSHFMAHREEAERKMKEQNK